MRKCKRKNRLREEIANVAGDGKVAGIGVGPQGEPPVKRKRSQAMRILKRVFKAG